MSRQVASAPAISTAGPCTARTPRCLNARDYQQVLRPCCRGHVRTLVAAVAEILNHARVTWWADYGTLLGAVRNPMTTWADYPWLPQDDRGPEPLAPGIIPHDKDADLGVLWRDFETVRKAVRALSTRGFHVTANAHRGSIKVRVSSRNHTNVDLFFWRGRGETMYRTSYAQVDAFKGREFHKDMIQPLSTVEWEGLVLPAPADPAAFLEMRYGPSWRKPVPANNDGVTR